MLNLSKTKLAQGVRFETLVVTSCFLFMKKLNRFLLLSVLFLGTYSVNATVYYVSSSGNDANSGTSTSTPWKTLTKVNSFTPKAGDQILFNRGDEWTGTVTVSASGTSGNPIVYGAYGSGDKPKIYGSEVITGWTKHSGSIYKASVDKTDIKQLFLNGSRMKIARYPDEGYFPITAANSTTQFSSTSLDGGINYTGATCILRNNAYTMYARQVSSSSTQTINLASAPVYPLNPGRGFFMVNKLAFLTSAGEWYYDNAANILYFWTPSDDSPANYQIRVSTFDYGVNISNKNYVTVKDLEILHSGIDGVYAYNTDYLITDNCNIVNPDLIGVHIASSNSTNATTKNNYIYGANGGGVRDKNYNAIITGNTIEETGQLKNINKATYTSDDNFGTAILSRGNNHIIQYNRIINTGYAGINFTGLNTNIKYNYIKGACQVLDDGGGIYCYVGGAYPNNSMTIGSIIENNIVFNVFGQANGGLRNFGNGIGIYLDGTTKGVTVRNNTVAGATAAMLINQGGQNVVEYNTFMDANLLLRVNKENEDSKVKNNILYQTGRLGTYVWWGSNTYQRLVFQENGGDIIFDNNMYIAHYNTTKVMSPYNSFEEWKTAKGQDSNSTFDGTPLTTGEKEELFYNDTKQTKTFKLGSSVYRDVYGKQVTGTFSTEPFTSKILIKTTSVINPDTTPPTISLFAIPSTSSSLTVPINNFNATDNIAVARFKLTETSVSPNVTDEGWTASAPTSYTFKIEGTKTLYAWAKDAAGNVSTSMSKQVVITLPPNTETGTLGNTELYSSLSTTANRMAIPVTFSEAGTVTSISIYHNGGKGNLLLGVYADLAGSPSSRLGVTSSTPVNSTAGWQTVSLITPLNVNSGQKVWLTWVFETNPGLRYKTTTTLVRALSTQAWSAGMPVSFGAFSHAFHTFSIYCSYYKNETSLSDVTKPVVNTFSIPSTSTSLVVSVNSFTASDNKAVTGYLITESSTAPLAGNAGWTTSAPASYSFTTEGTKTLYAWAKDAAGNVSASLNGQVTITSTVGNTDVYSSATTTANRMAIPVTFSEAGTVTSISIYHNGGKGNLLLGVYADLAGSPSSRLGVTSSTPVNSTAGWQTVSLITPLNVNSGQKVWLTWVFETNPGLRYKTTTTLVRALSTQAWSAGMPVSFGAFSHAFHTFSIYCSYYKNETNLKDAIILEGINIKPDSTVSFTEKNNSEKALIYKSFVNSLEINDFKLYPNPAHSFVNVDYSDMPVSGTTIEIIDSNGRTFYKNQAESSSIRIDISRLPVGLYFVKSISHQKYKVKKMIVK
jgi:hypothetical protein